MGGGVFYREDGSRGWKGAERDGGAADVERAGKRRRKATIMFRWIVVRKRESSLTLRSKLKSTTMAKEAEKEDLDVG